MNHRRVVTTACLALALSQCSTTEETGDNYSYDEFNYNSYGADEASNYNQSNANNYSNSGYNENSNYESYNSYANYNSYGNYDSANVNNSSYNEFGGDSYNSLWGESTNNASYNEFANLGAGQNALFGGNATSEAILPAEPLNSDPLPEVTEETSSPPAAVADLTPQVFYARFMVDKRNGPEGNIVGSLEQGDHPVVIEQANWAELSNGTFVPMSALSQQGIGRARKSRGWNLGY